MPSTTDTPALRLHPPVPTNTRATASPTTLPRGGSPDGTSPLPLPAGTIVAYNFYALHRLPQIWGVDADEFRPERWEGRKGGSWDWVPFNGDGRVFLGREFLLPSWYV